MDESGKQTYPHLKVHWHHCCNQDCMLMLHPVIAGLHVPTCADRGPDPRWVILIIPLGLIQAPHPLLTMDWLSLPLLVPRCYLG